jgi:hypothetical protein
MPLNFLKLEQQLTECDNKLSALFLNEEDKAILEHVQAIKNYYRLSYTKAKKKQTVEAIICDYEGYLTYLEQIKQFSVASFPDISVYENACKKARDFITYSNDSRYLNVIKHNLLKVCELIFWASTALTLYASIYLLALPMILVQPVLGVAMMITIGGFLLKTAMNFIKCFVEFKSLERHKAEYKHEISLLSFFSPKKPDLKPETSAELPSLSPSLP